jgi:hypothetical protein
VIGGCRRNTISVPSATDKPSHSSGSKKGTYDNTATFYGLYIISYIYFKNDDYVGAYESYEFTLRPELLAWVQRWPRQRRLRQQDLRTCP